MKKLFTEFPQLEQIGSTIVFPSHDIRLHNNSINLIIDIYYNEIGHPKYVHDKFGANAIEDFRIALIREIIAKNKTQEIWFITPDAYAIKHSGNNCDAFVLDFCGLKSNICKKTIEIKTVCPSSRE